MRLGGLSRAGQKAGMLPINKHWAWSTVPVFVYQKDGPGASGRRNWAAEAGWGQIVQAEGWCRSPGEQQRRRGGGGGGGLFCEAFRWEWLGDGEGEGAGSASLVGGGGCCPLRGCGWRESRRDLGVLPMGAGWSWDLRVVPRIFMLLEPGLSQED